MWDIATSSRVYVGDQVDGYIDLQKNHTGSTANNFPCEIKIHRVGVLKKR